MARYIPEGTILHNHRCLPELQILQNKTWWNDNSKMNNTEISCEMTDAWKYLWPVSSVALQR
jgi:hypothetical protein